MDPKQQHWWWRLLGVAIVLATLVAYQPTTGGAVHGLILPLVMGAAAVLIVQNLLAVLLAGSLLAGIHGQWQLFGAGDWVANTAYPLLCILCAVAALAILGQRFRARIKATHAERWQRRRQP